MKKKYKFRITTRDLNIVRRIHISLLAKPKDRYLIPWPDPKLEQTLPAQVSQAAMKSKPSERTIMLFKSKKMYVEGKKYEPPKKPDHYVEPPALNAVASARIVKLAQPKVLKKVKKQLSPKQLARRKKKFQKYKRERETWLKKRAMPKKVPPPQPIPVERKWSFPVRKSPPLTPLQRFERLLILAQPSAHRMKKDEPPRRTGPPFKEVTDRVRELAIPRRIPSETLKNMKFRPGVIKRNVLRAKTSERTKTLAKPRPRSKAVDNDVREDAFTIPPNALTYKASRRIVELAKPRKR